MPETFPHLRLLREEPVNPRRTRRTPIHIPEPSDSRAFGTELHGSLTAARERSSRELGGFDDRRLIKLQLDSRLDPDELKHISTEIEIVSQEDKSVVLAFATDAALTQFEERLSTLAAGGTLTYRNVIYALRGFDNWTEEDRKGWALRREGWPTAQPFSLDVELWPISSATDRDQLWRRFEAWLREQAIERLDAVKQSGLLLYRVRARRDQADKLLKHRDVRMVDLPPRWGLEIRLLQLDIQDIPQVSEPSEDAPGIVVLDSGIIQSHPLLAPAVGDAQSFIKGLTAEDEHGHGTLVAGIALYGDVISHAETRNFVPSLRLFSGRVLDADNQADERLVENSIDEAVRYFHEQYACRVFNLSYGDLRKPYRGGHVRGLAVTLDRLSRDLGVLFVVPTGNFDGEEDVPADWRAEYPRYLLTDEAALLDPAPALNVLTVGSIVRWDATHNSQRYTDDPAEQPIARRGQISPFSRRGPSVNGAIKPELMAYGGNWALNERVADRLRVRQGLGELSTSKDFASGRLLAECVGTSFAVPAISHLAARILTERPGAGANVLRVLLVTHARWPEAIEDLFGNKDDRLGACGYGQVVPDALLRSEDHEVTLIAEESIPDRSHHFYEVPTPDEFWEGRRRSREIAVGLAYCPAVRTTRVAYKSSRIEFRLVDAAQLSQVARAFNAATSADQYERIPEVTGAHVGATKRGAGTVQADRWIFRQPSAARRQKRLYLVVTRNDYPWAREITSTVEPYALAVVLRDRENADARLYTQVQARLAGRVRVRARA